MSKYTVFDPTAEHHVTTPEQRAVYQHPSEPWSPEPVRLKKSSSLEVEYLFRARVLDHTGFLDFQTKLVAKGSLHLRMFVFECSEGYGIDYSTGKYYTFHSCAQLTPDLTPEGVTHL